MAVSKSLLFLAAPAFLAAQPTAYTVTEVNAMLSGPPGVNMTIYRDGTKAVVDLTQPGAAARVRTFYDLQSHATYGWNPDSPGSACSKGTFSGDWGDPFALSGEVNKQNPKEVGSDSVNGIPAKVMEASAGGGNLKAWVDPKTGLVLKAQMAMGKGAPQTLVEVKQLSLAKPAASIFELPAACGTAAAAPPRASETAGNAADFADALMPPPSKTSCTVYVRVLRAGSMQPIAGGFQLALDTTYNVDHPAHYVIGSAGGRATFSGGGLHEVTEQMRNGAFRIDNPPPYFQVEAYFGKGGDSSALIYRQCAGPDAVLLLVVKNPDQLSDGADWRWAKSGKFAEPPR